jgi:hypothetical protein
MDPGQLLTSLIGGYFFLLAGFAAITTAEALEEDDARGLGTRVFRSLTKTTLFLGLPGLIALLVFLNSESRGDGGGIMSKNTGLFVLFVIGALGLLVLWVGAITLGLAGSAVVRNLPPKTGAALMFLFVCGAPLLMAGLSTLVKSQHQTRRQR